MQTDLCVHGLYKLTGVFMVHDANGPMCWRFMMQTDMCLQFMMQTDLCDNGSWCKLVCVFIVLYKNWPVCSQFMKQTDLWVHSSWCKLLCVCYDSWCKLTYVFTVLYTNWPVCSRFMMQTDVCVCGSWRKLTCVLTALQGQWHGDEGVSPFIHPLLCRVPPQGRLQGRCI